MSPRLRTLACSICTFAVHVETMVMPGGVFACAYQNSLPPIPLLIVRFMSHRSQVRRKTTLFQIQTNPLQFHTQKNKHYRHRPLWMTIDDETIIIEGIAETMTNDSDATTRKPIDIESTSFHDEMISTASLLATGSVLNQSEKTNNVVESSDAVFDNLLPSTRAFTSSRTNNILSPNKTRQRNAEMGPTSMALFQSSLSSTTSKKSKNMAEENAMTWKERLVNVSNIASFLCILDCTLLPLFSVVMPALSWGAGAVVRGKVGGAATSAAAAGSGFHIVGSALAYLPTLSHGIALYFVIPMGMLTSIINYHYGHGEWKFSLFSWMGLVLIFIANSSFMSLVSGSVGMDVSHLHHHAHDACGAVVGAATSMVAHTCPSLSGGGEGLIHLLTNTLGCALLLGSNYAGKKYMEKAKEDNVNAKGCAASVFSEAWGGGIRGVAGDRGRAVFVCGCNDCGPTYGASSARKGGNFFQWKQNSGFRR